MEMPALFKPQLSARLLSEQYLASLGDVKTQPNTSNTLLAIGMEFDRFQLSKRCNMLFYGVAGVLDTSESF
jgi:hypothetical protein